VKTFYSLDDIETLVAQGVRELIVDEDAVLTDVAQDAAARLGLKLLPKASGPAAPARPQPAAAAPMARPAAGPGSLGLAAGAKPRGCQHGPLEGSDPRATTGQTGTPPGSRATGPGSPSGGLMDDLVGAVKQMASRGSAG
jgi:hypothetical protein